MEKEEERERDREKEKKRNECQGHEDREGAKRGKGRKVRTRVRGTNGGKKKPVSLGETRLQERRGALRSNGIQRRR